MKIHSVFYTLLLTVLVAGKVSAHDARPVVVTLSEQLDDVYQYSLRVPVVVQSDNQPVLVWPTNCRPLEGGGQGNAGRVMNCEGGLEGQDLTLAFPVYNPSLGTFMRLTNLEGASSTTMLSPTQPVWAVPTQPGGGNVAGEYLLLGIEHIIGGADHLLFVLGLLVIARTLKRILWTITGFTLAHSITLSLSSLGVITIPIVPVEAAIALSILFLAFEISREHQQSLTYRFPLIISFSFGLLHGLGFASALGEIGLVPNEVLVSLLFFNLGVEAGQVLFIVMIMALLGSVHHVLVGRLHFNNNTLRLRSELAAAYIIGIPAAYWLIERSAQYLI